MWDNILKGKRKAEEKGKHSQICGNPKAEFGCEHYL